MEKKGLLIFVVIAIAITLIGFVSAGFWNDLWNKITGKAITGNVINSEGNEYQLREVIELPRYLWHMTTINNTVYSATYSGGEHIYYSNPPFEQWDIIQVTGGTEQESTRVYNLNGRLYAPGEYGSVWADGKMCVDIGSDNAKYLIAAEYFQGKYLMVVANDHTGKGRIYDCPCENGQTCTEIWGGAIGSMAAFDAEVYKGDLYLTGASVGNGRTSSRGKIYKLNSQGQRTTIKKGGIGTGVSLAVFDGKLFSGHSYNARVISFDGTALKDEIKLDGFDHFGDIVVYDGKLFIAVVKGGTSGYTEIYSRKKDSDGGQWAKIFSAQQLTKYGERGGLVNPSGFFTTYKDRLFMNVGSKNGIDKSGNTYRSRKGPGYILEITKIPSSDRTNCDMPWYNSSITLTNNTLSENNQFLCMNGNFYYCSKDSYSPLGIVKATNAQVIGNWSCDLNNEIWLSSAVNNTSPAFPQNQTSPLTPLNNNVGNINGSDSDSDGVSDYLDVCSNTLQGMEVNSRGCRMPRWGKFKNYSSDLNHTDLNRVNYFKLANEKGVVSFKEQVDLQRSQEVIDLDSYVNIEQNKVSIDTTRISELNKSATLTFYNVTFLQPKILIDGVKCLDCRVLSYRNNVLIVLVSHFTTYEVVENGSSSSPVQGNESNNTNGNVSTTSENPLDGLGNESIEDLWEESNFSDETTNYYDENETEGDNLGDTMGGDLEDEESSGNGFMKVLIWIILILIFAGISYAAYYFLRKRNQTKGNSTLPNALNPQQNTNNFNKLT